MKKVLLLLANGFEIFEASVFIDVIGWNLVAGDKTTQLFTCGMQKEVCSTFNQKLQVDYTIDQIDVNDFEAVAVPGGFREFNFLEDAYSSEFTGLIKQFHQQGKVVASICTGAFPVAKSGILNNKCGTTYNLNTETQASLKEMGVNVLNQPIVDDHNIITSWNPSTAMNVALLLLKKLTNAENANAIKAMMGFEK